MLNIPLCTELERVMHIIGAAAAKLKKRLDMIYEVGLDASGRKFSGLHDTLLPMATKTRSIFQQLSGSKSKSSKRQQESDASAAKKQASMSGKILGSITGCDLRHLLRSCCCCFPFSFLIFWTRRYKVTISNMELTWSILAMS